MKNLIGIGIVFTLGMGAGAIYTASQFRQMHQALLAKALLEALITEKKQVILTTNPDMN